MKVAPDVDRIQSLAEVAEDLVDDLRFHRQVERLHALGLRATGELLLEIAECIGCRTFIDQRLEAYAALDPETVRAVAGDQFPRPPLYGVKS